MSKKLMYRFYDNEDSYFKQIEVLTFSRPHGLGFDFFTNTIMSYIGNMLEFIPCSNGFPNFEFKFISNMYKRCSRSYSSPFRT